MTKESRFDSGRGQYIHLVSKASKLAVEPNQTCIRWMPEAVSGKKMAGL